VTGHGSPAGQTALRLATMWPRRGPVVMGILNCTPDSFSDGGRHPGLADAVRHGERMLDEGADVVDVGGESTRPGAPPVPEAEELRRVVPVIRELRRRRPQAVLSVDTTKPAVAAAALEAGADVVNDVSGARESGMLGLVAAAGAAIVLMHMRGTPRDMQHDTGYDDVVAEVHHHLRGRAAAAREAGVGDDRIWLDPGIGFGKDADGNLALLAALPALAACGHPVVVGPSRKSFLGRLTGAGTDRRLPGTLAALIPAIGLERAVLRVHEPGPVRQFATVAAALAGVRP